MPDKEMAFDDGSEVEIECEEEDPPRSGEWVDSESLFDEMTEEETEAGEFLGKVIDPDDDEDSGEQWGTVENPTMTAEDFAELGGEG